MSSLSRPRCLSCARRRLSDAPGPFALRPAGPPAARNWCTQPLSPGRVHPEPFRPFRVPRQPFSSPFPGIPANRKDAHHATGQDRAARARGGSSGESRWPEDETRCLSPKMGHGSIDLDEAARQLEQEADDAQVPYDTLSLGDLGLAHTYASPPARSRIVGWTSFGIHLDTDGAAPTMSVPPLDQ
jgi:hypothetical protein